MILLAFSPDGTLLAWHSATAGLWDMNSGELLYQLLNNAEPLVAALAFTPVDRLLLAIRPYGYLEIGM